MLLLSCGHGGRSRSSPATSISAPTRTLFPIWPQYHWPEIHGLLGLTVALLFGPKLLALALRLWSTRGARRFGGRPGADR